MIFLLHNIGTIKSRNYNTKSQIESSSGILTFDGVYRNVWEHRELLRCRKIILFIMGGYVGGNNKFDRDMPYERFCDWNEIMDLVFMGCKIGWHTWTHRDLTKLSDVEILKEITPPFPMETFAYPYGRFNDRIIELVKSAGFSSAYGAGKRGDGTLYQLKRSYL